MQSPCKTGNACSLDIVCLRGKLSNLLALYLPKRLLMVTVSQKSENRKTQILPKRIYFNRFEGKKLPAGAIQVHYGQVDGR